MSFLSHVASAAHSLFTSTSRPKQEPRCDLRHSSLHGLISPAPVVWYLSGLTCTEENFTVKAGAQRIAAELGLLLIAPDTSPRFAASRNGTRILRWDPLGQQ